MCFVYLCCNSNVKTVYDFIYAHALCLILMKISTGKCLRPLTRDQPLISASISEYCTSQTLQCKTFFLFVSLSAAWKKYPCKLAVNVFCCMIEKWGFIWK